MAEIMVGSTDELPEGKSRVVQHNGRAIAVFHRAGGYHAIEDTCPHMGGSLGMGWCTDGDTVVCPLHGWEFRLADGQAVWPSGMRVTSYDVKVADGDLFVIVEDGR